MLLKIPMYSRNYVFSCLGSHMACLPTRTCPTRTRHVLCLPDCRLTSNDPNSKGSSAVILIYGATVSNIFQPHFLTRHCRLFPGKPWANSMVVNPKRGSTLPPRPSSMDPSPSTMASHLSFPSAGCPPSQSTSNHLSMVSPGIKYGSLMLQLWTMMLLFPCSLHHPPSPLHCMSTTLS